MHSKIDTYVVHVDRKGVVRSNMASVVEGAFFLEETDSEEDDDEPQQKANSLMVQNFDAFVSRMHNVGYREQSTLLSENAAQESFNKGFEEAAKGSLENGFIEGRRHAKKLFGTKTEVGEMPSKATEQPVETHMVSHW